MSGLKLNTVERNRGKKEKTKQRSNVGGIWHMVAALDECIPMYSISFES